MTKAAEDLDDVYQLGPMQLGMLFHTLGSPTPGMYVVQSVYRLDGRLDVAAFGSAWHDVVQRHPVLRAGFVWEKVSQPLQAVLREVEVPLDLDDWAHLADTEQGRLTTALLDAEREREFDLTQAPLMRIALRRLGPDRHLCAWSFHHMLLDGWSMTRVLNEVLTFYSAKLTGDTPQLSPVRPYRAFVDWSLAQSTNAAESRYRDLLAGFTTPTAVPLDGIEATADDRGYGQHESTIDAAATDSLQQFATTQRTTLGTVANFAWSLLLARTTSTTDVLFGRVLWGRPTDLPGAGDIVGPCINSQPVRLCLEPEATSADQLTDLQQLLTDLQQHEHVPLATVQRWSEIPASKDLFSTLLVFQSFPDAERLRKSPNELGLTVTEVATREYMNHPLVLEIGSGDVLELKWVYHPQRIGPAAVAELDRMFRRLLERLADDPDQRVEQLLAVDPEEQEALLALGAGREVDGWRGPVLRDVESASTVRGDAHAVVDESGTLSHDELMSHARALAARLAAEQVGTGDIVAVLAPRSRELVTAILGVAKAGGVYLPLDPGDPPKRLAQLLEDARASAVVAIAALVTKLPPDARVFEIDLTDAARPEETICPPPDPGALDLAYAVFTSGSTGQPKGVGITQAGLSIFAWWAIRHLGITAAERHALVCNPAFDASVGELWPTLARGGCLVVPPDETVRDPARLAAWMTAERITCAFLPTPLAEAVLAVDGSAPSSMRTLMTSGGRLRNYRPPRFEARLTNAYGVAESTVTSTVADIGAHAEQLAAPPVGSPIEGAWVGVVDADLTLVPLGVTGELVLGGAGLARGYLGHPGKTAKEFVPNAFSQRPGERMYRTGDLARWLPDGQLEFLGRADEQIKVRGFRVEPGEIEVALRSHPQVRDAAVSLVVVPAGAPVLCAYVVTDRQPADDLRDYLRDLLPDHMVPAVIERLVELPLTSNGKLDRRGLPEPSWARPDGAETYAEPDTEVQRRLATAWSEVLPVDEVGVDDNFFDLGGDSIASIRLVAHAAQAGLELSPADVFQHQTVRELAPVARDLGISDSSDDEVSPAAPRRASGIVIPISGTDDALPIVLVHPMNGHVACYFPLARHLEPQQVLGIQAVAEAGDRERSVSGLAAYYIQALRAKLRGRPMALAGWSFGGVIAFEMAAQLAAAGDEVHLLALIDTPGPAALRLLPEFDDARVATLLQTELSRRYGQGAVTAADGIAEHWVSGLRAAYQRRLGALWTYRPEPYAGRVTLFRATQPPTDIGTLPPEMGQFLESPDFGWSGVAKTEVVPIPGNHDELVYEPHVTVLGEQLRAALQRAAQRDHIPAGSGT